MSKLLSSIGSESGFRAEIQGLRAVAIALVLIFHVWPESISGGYVGVDVFFVISGYLITRVLFQEYASTGRIDVARFYERRIRRLMPAATLVLLASALLLFLLPATQREDGAKSILASALYVQNWWLSAQAVDYLAAESAPGLLNHFWSLAVEEQYYIFWPVMVFAVGWLFVRAGKTHARAFTVLVVTVLICSLAYSIWLTETNPQRAYFSTFTRAWELAIGGFLAVSSWWREIDVRWRNLLGLAGLAAILAAAFLYDTSTPFPGYAAALPTLGAAMIIVAGQSGSFASAYRIMALKPMQVLGDVSYSLYLWHWPVIISYMALVGHSPGVIDGLALVAISFALAYTTKALVEDRYRHHGHQNSRRNAFMMGGGFIAAACLAGFSVYKGPMAFNAYQEVRVAVKDSGLPSVMDNPGANSLWKGVEVNTNAALVPSSDVLKADFPAPYLHKCISRGLNTELKECRYGSEGGKDVVLIGDAYALQWQPALAEIAKNNGWSLRVYAKTGCLLGDIPQSISGLDSEKQHACDSWKSSLQNHLKEHSAEVVFIGQNPRPQLMGGINVVDRQKLVADALKGFLGNSVGSEASVILIRGVPSIGKQCNEPERLMDCAKDREASLPAADPVLIASGTAGSLLLDLTNGICDSLKCHAVVGNVAVYRSSGQLSATYARTMAGYIADSINGLGVFDSPLSFEYVENSSVHIADMSEKAVLAKHDNPDLYRDGCHLGRVASEPRSCIYGSEDARIKVVLAGDSHSAQWLPALQVISKEFGWQIYSFTKSACAFSDTVVKDGKKDYSACTEWNSNVMARIAEIRPDLLFMSQSRGQWAYGTQSPDESTSRLADGLVSRWKELQSMGISVVVVADTPWMEHDIPDCLSSVTGQAGGCDAQRESAFKVPDSLVVAHDRMPSVGYVNINDHICDASWCRAVVDGEVVFRDRHHLTASFARKLSPEIGRVAADAMK